MFKIKEFNNISPVAKEVLGEEKYAFVSEGADYDAALVRSAELKDEKFPENLLAIARAGAGVNNIPVERCSEEGIVVFNTPGANANAVKELVLCGMLLSCRKIIHAAEWVANEKKNQTEGIEKLAEKAKKNFVGPELAGKTLGVIGLGAIGVLVANAAANGLDMNVIGYDPFMNVNSALHLSRRVKLSQEVEELYEKCDYITLHLPLNKETEKMINKAAIEKMKDNVVLLNFARGALADNAAVLEALKEKKLRAYVTDFAADELVGEEGVIALPHLGASTPEAEENCAEMAAEELKDFIENGNVVNSVNLPECKMARAGKERLTVINRNVANMLGQIATVLAAEGLNIEHMLNKGRGAYAYTMIDTNEEIPQNALDKIKAIDGVLRVRVL